MKITWLGHSCFKLEKEGYTLILDPYADGSVPGLLPIREEADQVLCSHGHGDHNAKSTVKIKGTAESPFTITTIDTYHDDKKGMLRGLNTIHIIDDGEIQAAHLGDLGCELEPEELELLSGLDAVMVPVGGFYTIDAAQAADLINRIRPGIVIPMHYRSDADGFGYDVLGTVSAFTDRMDRVRTVEESELEITDYCQTQVIVLQPRNR